MEINA